ncbi:hypothetical protein SAMN05421823_102126 [Catalinimonas alkaloidigena]|uniref:Uncharacterized protein n=1 Tax=Catalinimonas alkaloidigena TaxID=1075417 RepID=A0A1G8ZYF5_9BACT|nr:hypothetical protein [Catalinimonas alkaloidigena]SDK20103.1 hypothetical protein SAMN05421823_102126 [Catalinimonas alkaloidigena]
MSTDFWIGARFCGPPQSANGGYTCGRLDHLTPYVSEVTLRKPPPLQTALSVAWEGDQLHLLDGETLIATCRPGAVEIAAPAPPTFAEAEAAAQHYLGLRQENPFPTCFVCGVQRDAGDGLHIFAGATDRHDLLAAPWVPDASLADAAGQVNNEFIWAALDCPGAYAQMADQPRILVLGRMTAQVLHPVQAGEKCVVVAWPKSRDGRKYTSGTALYNADQQLCAVSHQTWIELTT